MGAIEPLLLFDLEYACARGEDGCCPLADASEELVTAAAGAMMEEGECGGTWCRGLSSDEVFSGDRRAHPSDVRGAMLKEWGAGLRPPPLADAAAAARKSDAVVGRNVCAGNGSDAAG